MRVGVVMPIGPGREDNVRSTLESLAAMTELPYIVVLVLDGPDASRPDYLESLPFPAYAYRTAEKHHPGMEQPRNVGVRLMPDSVSHVWFLDSDILVTGEALSSYVTMEADLARRYKANACVMIGPYYELLPPGQRAPIPEMKEDPRWPMFEERDGEVTVGELGTALGCWSGNLVWPIDRFKEIGGFDSRLHHGRCEDGELGIRTARHRIPIVCVAAARGWHLHHERNMDWILATNAIDVPLIHAWHGAAEEYQGLVPVPTEGVRLEYACPHCEQLVNTGEIWSHQVNCR